MKFTTREDIEAPIEFVFETLSDFETFEKQAMRRGADIVRTDDYQRTGPGMTWQVSFPFRGKIRESEARLASYDKPNAMTFISTTGGLEADARAELVALSARRTRLRVDIELKPKTLSARLLVQSLRLAKGNLARRLDKRVEAFAEEVEDRYQARG